MADLNFAKKLDAAKGLADIFELVKDAARVSLHKSRGGLMLGLADLGNHPQGFIGAFFPVGTNIIVMNKIPLVRIKETKPEMYKPYIFHVLLHEYLHTLGWLDEATVRQLVFEVSKEFFGETHIATQIARDTAPFFKNLVYPSMAWQPEELKLELVEGFDRGSVNYIA